MKSAMDLEAIESAAADWLGRRDGGFAPGEAAAFEAWLAEDPRHFAAVAEIEAAWGRLNAPRAQGQAGAVLARLSARQAWRRKLGWSVAAAVAVAAVVVFAFVPKLLAPAPTFAVRPDLQRLPDGSVVELNAGAELAVDYTPGERGVRLLRGEAHFAVVKDPGRPFIVAAQGVHVRAVGTAFTVRAEANQVDVLVTEGRVSVAPAGREGEGGAAAAPETFLVAGESTVVPLDMATAPAVQRVSAGEITAALAWREKRVEFMGTPLGEAIALFNRQNEIQLAFGEADLAELQVGGIFWADDPEGFVRLLEGSFGIHATKVDARKIVLHR